jgi:hypothetical protein
VPREKNEPVRLTSIYTRGGDAGQTSLGDGSRVSKLDPRIAALMASAERDRPVADSSRRVGRDGREFCSPRQELVEKRTCRGPDALSPT